MKRIWILAGILLAFGAAQVGAQTALHYDPYYVLPGAAGGMGVDAGLSNVDISSLLDATDVYLMGKYSVSSRLEAGFRLTFGFLNDGRESFSEITVGAKFGLGEKSAITLNLTPFNEIEETGFSMGYMQTLRFGDMNINNHLQVGLREAYAPEGVPIHLLIEPVKVFSDKLSGYLDVLISTNTSSPDDDLTIDLGPNLDFLLAEGLLINAGITLGVAGDLKQDEIGLIVTAIKVME